MKKIRLDVFLVKKKLVSAREKAKELIKNNLVFVNNKLIKKSSYLINKNDKIEIKYSDYSPLRFVSRGGIKLDFALKTFKINVDDKVCLDIGASTGGFTDCLLKHNAKNVVCVDVGKEQLHPSLKKNEKIIYHEKTDIRNFKTKQKFDFICCDVSFISLTKIIPVLKNFTQKGTKIILLIKPQFETQKKSLNKNGVIKDITIIENIIKKIIAVSEKNGFTYKNLIPSPIKGKEGNTEFLIFLES